jgi:hypothetical protein
MNNEVSSETGVISPVKNSPIFTTIYLHTEDAMDDIKTEEKKYVGSVLKFEDKNIGEFFTGEITPVSELTSLFICSSKSTLRCPNSFNSL